MKKRAQKEFYHFNPFDKDISELSGKDLCILRNVHEGWYVDYKREMISTKDLGKHFSAFANQYGGWLFIGIEETDDQRAGEFKGIDASKLPDYLETIKYASSAHTSPDVYYLQNIIKGPIGNIGLEIERAIIVIYIPQGRQSPYVHSSGRIYRRVADQSDPKPETDRHILDHLWQRRKQAQKKLKRQIREIPTYPYNISNPIIHVNFISNPYFDKDYPIIEFSKFRSIISQDNKSKKLSIPFDLYHTTANGFLARQTSGRDPSLPSISFRWWHNGNARISIVLNVLNFDTTGSGENFQNFKSKAENSGFKNIEACDLTQFYVALVASYTQYRQILDLVMDGIPDIYYAILIEGAFNQSPYIDDQKFVADVKTRGIPVVQDNNIFIPHDILPENLLQIKAIDYCRFQQDAFMSGFSEMGLVYHDVFTAFGVICDINDISRYQSVYDLQKLCNTGKTEK